MVRQDAVVVLLDVVKLPNLIAIIIFKRQDVSMKEMVI
jgi:hypothetical protein